MFNHIQKNVLELLKIDIIIKVDTSNKYFTCNVIHIIQFLNDRDNFTSTR